jgi:hypothetical protein
MPVKAVPLQNGPAFFDLIRISGCIPELILSLNQLYSDFGRIQAIDSPK